MKLILIHRYFWPDSPPYASMLRTMARSFAREGHTVEILTAQPSYASGSTRQMMRETVDGITVRRLPVARERRKRSISKLVNMALFPAMVGVSILRTGRPDLVMCSTVPQVTLGFAVALAARVRRAAFVYHCMDLHPEIGRISGDFANPVVYRVLSLMDRWTMRRATRIVVLSQDMAKTVIERDPALRDKIVVLNNFALPDEGIAEETPLPVGSNQKLRVVFTGNLGRFQGLDSVIEATALIDEQVQLELIFMGEGQAQIELEHAAARAHRDNVDITFLPHGSVGAAKALMRTAHLGLVSLVPGVVRYAYPSKTATYAEQDLPVLVVCEQDSQLSTAVQEEKLGWSVAPADKEGLARAFTEAFQELQSGSLQNRRKAVGAYAMQEFDQDLALTKWAQLVTESTRGWNPQHG